jgi:hypothetical protein
MTWFFWSNSERLRDVSLRPRCLGRLAAPVLFEVIFLFGVIFIVPAQPSVTLWFGWVFPGIYHELACSLPFRHSPTS